MLAFLPVNEQRIEALDNGGPCGAVTYAVSGDTVEIISLSSDEASVREGLLRAALHDAMRRGARIAVCNNAALLYAFRECGLGDAIPVSVDVVKLFTGRSCR